jgi:hypothetical protein
MEIESSPTAKKHKLRWFQYSLRSLFILTTLVASACSWLATTFQNQRKQKAAAEAIEKAGGLVMSEPTWLGTLLRDDSLVRVTRVSFPKSATDAELVHLRGLNQLRRLDLGFTKVTDAGLPHLQGLSRLRELRLNDTKVTDAGLAILQGLSELQELQLDNTKVTDAGLANLQALSELERMGLYGTKVTNEGVKKFREASPKCLITRRYPAWQPID